MLSGSLETGCFTFGILISRCDNPQPKVHRGGGSKLTIGARPEGVASVGTSIKPHQRTPIIPAFHRIKGPRSLPPPFKPVSRRYFIVLVENLFAGPGHGTTMDAVDAARMGFVLMA